MKLIIKKKQITRTNGEKSEVLDYILNIEGIEINLIPQGDYNYQKLVKSIVYSTIPSDSDCVILVKTESVI